MIICIRLTLVVPPIVGTMPQIALVPRNVFVYDASVNPMVLIAGCHQFGHFTNAEFYFCLGICFQQPHPDDFRLLADDQTILQNDGNILPVGQYYVISSSLLVPFFNYADMCSRPCSIQVRCTNSGIGTTPYYFWFNDSIYT